MSWTVTRTGALLIAGFLTWSAGLESRADSISVFSLNIAWYGLGGSMDNSPADEHRDHDLARIVADAFETQDVGVFEEIVDVGRFVSNVAPRHTSCHSYDNDTAKHQHVVVCVKAPLKFKALRSAPDHVWEDVAIGKTRPAVVGRISNASNSDIAHLVAVHLKSSPEYSSIRRQQAAKIASHIKEEMAASNIPVLVIGDFNTFEDDASAIGAELSGSGMEFSLLRNPSPFTFNNRRYQNKFDHIYYAGPLSPSTFAMVAGPCNTFESVSGGSDGFHSEFMIRTHLDDLDDWNRMVSDHCLIHASFVTSPNPGLSGT